MPVIRTSVFIAAPAERCFDLARSIDIHMLSASHTGEKAVAGRTSGLIRLHESVTWEAVHLGVRQRLTVQITEMEPPHRFVDEMVSGAFRRFWHEHRFTPTVGGTVMTDTFDYTSPLGWLGRLADLLFLERYMRDFLIRRNAFIKQCAEEKAEA